MAVQLQIVEKSLLMRVNYFYLFAILFLFSCKKDNPGESVITPLSDTIIKNIAYGNNAANVFDLYLPVNRNDDTKIIILIHGGGWSGGDKNELGFLAQGLSQRGFAVANINYRLSPQSDDNYKMQLDDISTLQNYLNAKASLYNYNSQKMYITGHSAGAHLALSFAYTKNSNGQIKAAGGMATPTDLVAGATENLGIVGATTIAPYLGAPLSASSRAIYENASPIYHVTNSTLPTILFQGNVDIIVAPNQAVSLDYKLKQNGVPEKLIMYPGIFHDWWANADLVKNTLDETAKWFNNY